MRSYSKSHLLAGVSLLFIATFSLSNNSYSCSTSGSIVVNCNLNGDTTGDITIGNTNAGVTVTITNDIIISHSIDDDDNAADGIIITDGGGRTISQTAAIGNTNNLTSLTLGLGDTWNSSASIKISDIDVNTGALNINNGADIFSRINDTGGVGTVNYGADMNGGTFNILGTIDTVALTISSGVLNTNGSNLGTGTALDAITVNTGARLNVNNNVTSIASITNNGEIRIKSGEILTTADQTDATGLFIYEVDSTTDFGKFVVSGANDVDITNATIKIEVGIGDIKNGDELLISDGNTAINAGAGKSIENITDNSYLWNFRIADGSQVEITTAGADNTQLYAIVSTNNTIQNASYTDNNANAGQTLLEISNTLNGQLQVIVGNMNQAATRKKLNDVIESTQPTVNGSHIIGGINISNAARDITTQRLAYLRDPYSSNTGMSAGDDIEDGHIANGWKLWGDIFGQRAKQLEIDGIGGYKSSTKGFTVGADTVNYVDDMVIGAAYSYGFTDIDSDNANNTETEISSYQLTLYGDYTPNKRSYINGMMSMSWNEVDTKRKNVGGVAGLVATGDTDGNQYSLSMETGRNYLFPGNMLVSPNITGNFIRYDTEDYTETGAFGANLIVNTEPLHILEFGAGVNFKWLIENEDATFFEPELRTSYSYDLIGDTIESTSKFVGAGSSFKTEGTEAARSTFNIGSSIKYYSSAKWEFTGNYDYKIKESYQSHSGSIRTAYKF